MADAQITEANLSAVVKVNTPARISEANVSALVKLSSGARISEANVSALVYRGPSSTTRCDLWLIERRDGVRMGFTSFDSDIEAFGVTFKSAGSLQDSASESSSDGSSTGSIELSGLITDDSITEADLYAGLYDDAYVECWVLSWGDAADPQTPFRVAAGWTGTVTRGQVSFTAEVLGPKARLQQAALVQFFQPGCRWAFGDANCQVDKTALEEAGIVVTGLAGRFTLQFGMQAIPAQTALWNGGYVLWTSGENAGQQCQTEVVDWEAGLLSLWDPAPFVPMIGDTFTVVPGCSYDKAGCRLYSNYINFGGFPDVPGPDALQQNASALFASG